MDIQVYLMPKSIDESLAELTSFKGKGMIIAGGTDLIPKLKHNKIDAEALIDVSEIEEINRLEIETDELVIGAATTHSQVCGNWQIKKIWPALADACGCIGSPQIRNIATLTGNVVNAQPAADSAIALIALGARMELLSNKGKRCELIENLYFGIGKSKINSSKELVTSIKVPRPTQRFGNAYGRISPRNSFCMPIVNAAVALECDGARISSSRVVMGPVGDKPFRSVKAEQFLTGTDLKESKAIDEAARLSGQEANPSDNCFRGCSDYQKELLKVLVKRVLEKAVFMAQNIDSLKIKQK